MDLHVFSTAIVFLVVLLRASLASGKECTNGFLSSLSVENDDSRRLFPLLGRTEAEQWIFPSLRFTCPGRLTKWIFRAVSAQTTSSQCRINIGTWRLDRSISGTVYRRLSTTERLRRITRDGLIFTYELASPVQVQPDDIVGVELESDFSSCSITGGFSNILSLDLSRTGTISQSYRRFVVDSAFRVNYLVPFIQPVIETVTSEEPTIGTAIFIASNAPENTTTTVTDPLTSLQAHDETITMTGNDPLSTTTEESSGLVNTNEPQDKKILIIHIVAGVGISTIALIGIVVACIGLVGIMKCMQARSAKGRQSDTEQPQLVISSSNGILLQENTAYRKSMNGWSTDTTGYETLSTEGGRNPDTENISKSDEMVGYETMSTKEQSKPDSTQPQDSSDSSGIVMQENTAYKKSTKSGDRQNKDANTNQCTNSSGIAVHKNTAYKKSTNSGGTVTGYETMDEIVEEVMQLNQAYGFQGESQEGINSINTGDYETMTGDSAYDYGSQAHRGVDKKSTMAMAQPVTYDVLIQQQNIIPEDGEHSYDYVI